MIATAFDDLDRPPSDADVDAALSAFAREVRESYGGRLAGLYLFGSRARGDHHPGSDADIAVVLRDEGWRFWDEKLRLSNLAFDAITDRGLIIQAWPFSLDEWRLERRSERFGSLLSNAVRDARPLGSPT